MPKPVSVSVDVPQPREAVFDFLDVMANHEPFTDHVLFDWSYSGPARGVGSKAHVHTKAGWVRDEADIEVVSARAPECIVERNVSAKGKRIAHGTYDLAELPAGGTRVSFTYAWEQTPAADRVLAPLVRVMLRRANTLAMKRLARQLPTG